MIDDDGDGFLDCDDFDCPPCEGGEICDNEIDDDGDGYVDCNDFDCPPCEGGEGSCAEYGCVDYTPSNACQCNDLCTEYGNCCDDYEDLCAGEDSGGSTGGGDMEICDDGIDNDGDSYIDCEDYNCNGTIGDLDPSCEGDTTGGGETGEVQNLFFSEYAEGSSNH